MLHWQNLPGRIHRIFAGYRGQALPTWSLLEASKLILNSTIILSCDRDILLCSSTYRFPVVPPYGVWVGTSVCKLVLCGTTLSTCTIWELAIIWTNHTHAMLVEPPTSTDTILDGLYYLAFQFSPPLSGIFIGET